MIFGGLFTVVSPFQIDGAPREARAERRQNQVVALVQTALPLVQAQWNGCRCCVAVFLDVYHHLFGRKVHLARHSVDDAQVGLMRNQPSQSVGGDAIALHNLNQHLLGVILLVMSVYFLIISERIRLRPTLPMQLSMGTLSGLMGGLFAMQGPPAVLYFVATEADKVRYLAMTQAYFFIGNVFMTVYRAQCGFCTPIVGRCWLYALVGVMIGSWLGRKVFDRIPSPTLRKVIYAYMAVINGRGYLCCGSVGSSKSDVWEYIPYVGRDNMGEWTEVCSFEGSPRFACLGFAIDGVGYVGTGTIVNANPSSQDQFYDDLWEFHPDEDYEKRPDR